MTPTVTVVMAAKNYAQYLPQAVESVLAQTWTDWELVIIDDGSTDTTPLAVRPFLTDPRIRWVRSDHLGQARAKNLGANLARGSFLAYLDADDAWEPTKLARQLAVMQSRPAVGVCFCRRSLMNDQGQPLPCPDRPAPRGRVLDQLFLRNFVCFSSVLLRRVVFEHVGLFDPEWDLAIDYDLWLRVCRHYELDYVDEPLVRYRTGHGNLSKRLSDRVATAEAIMNRAVYRRGLTEELSAAVIGEGYSTTYQALAYTLRQSEPGQALRWYARALQWPGRRRDSIRGVMGTIWSWLRGNSEPARGENASTNR